jgi:hypothetical protein
MIFSVLNSVFAGFFGAIFACNQTNPVQPFFRMEWSKIDGARRYPLNFWQKNQVAPIARRTAARLMARFLDAGPCAALRFAFARGYTMESAEDGSWAATPASM